jgi:hypothetical protein
MPLSGGDKHLTQTIHFNIKSTDPYTTAEEVRKMLHNTSSQGETKQNY